MIFYEEMKEGSNITGSFIYLRSEMRKPPARSPAWILIRSRTVLSGHITLV